MNAEEILKEIGLLVGAVNGNYIEKTKELIKQYHLKSWQLERLIELVETVMGWMENSDINRYYFLCNKLNEILSSEKEEEVK